MTFSLFNNKPYRGGPNFERLSTHCFDLGGTGLELTVPASDFVMKEPPRMLNFPFQNVGWFDAHCKRRNLHDELSVFCEIWNYFPAGVRRMVNLLAMGSNERMGGLCLIVDLNRVEKGRELDLSDQRAMAAYINWEYGNFYESPEQGLNCRGKNYQVREEYGRRYRHGQPDQDKVDREQYEAALRNYLEPIPKDFETVSFGDAQWTHYKVNSGWAVTTDYYCTPLSELYYLEIELEFRFEVADRNRTVLEPDMRRTADWLLQHVKVTRPMA
jgi:hypothetical protein